jgi:hypothetical protein
VNIVKAEERHAQAPLGPFVRRGVDPPEDIWPTRIAAPRAVSEAYEAAVRVAKAVLGGWVRISEMSDAIAGLAASGARALAVAFGSSRTTLHLAGLVALEDPPRADSEGDR